MKRWASNPIILAISGLVLLLSGIFLCLFSPCLFHKIIQAELPLTKHSRGFELWQNTSSFPMYLNVYFFNWTNPEDITIPGTKPNLVEVGPYCFREIKEKVNITFHAENSTVSYLQRKWWYFDEKRSNGSLKDNITQLNVVALSAAHKSRRMWEFMQASLSLLLKSLGKTIHIHKTVDELLFTGYEDKIIDLGRAASPEEAPPFDRFGWFYKRNGSTDFEGHGNMATGQDDINNLGVLKMWNHKDTIKFYKSPCNAVEGSAGSFWPPYRTKEDIMLFSADLCRPLTYEFVDEIEHKDISAYKFEVGRKTLGNNTKRRYPHEQAKYFQPTTTTEDFFEAAPSTEQPETWYNEEDTVNVGHCYCNGQCSPMGLINVTACRYGAPAFVSLPHFYKGDPSLRRSIEGMNPKKELHDFYITLEPNTGIPIDVAARLQVNMLLQSSKNIEIYQNVPTLYFPVFWFSMQVEIPDDFAISLKHLVMLPKLGLYVGVMLMFLGSFAIFLVAVICYVQKREDHKRRISKNVNASEKKAEIMYYDRTQSEDLQARSDRQLYHK